MKGETPMRLDMSNVLEAMLDSFHVSQLPEMCSKDLKDLVYAALSGNSDTRPNASESDHQTAASLSLWAGKSDEGRRDESSTRGYC